MKRLLFLLFIYIACLGLTNHSRADILTGFGQRVFGIPVTTLIPWGSGWSHIQSYAGVDGFDYFLLYSETSGVGYIDKVATGGHGFEVRYNANWGAGWSHIVPFRINGKNYFLAYNKINGAVRFNEISNGGRTVTTVWTGTWGTGWSHISPFYIIENGQEKTALLTYNNSTLNAFFNLVNTSLQGVYTAKVMTWERYDEVHVFSNKNNDNKLIKFNRANGVVHYEQIRTDFAYLPRIGTYTGIPADTLTSVAQSADTIDKLKSILLLYTPSTGRLEHRPITDLGVIPGKVTLWRKNLSHLASFLLRSITPFDGMIMAYSKSHGGSQFFRVNDRSKLICNGVNRCEFKNLPLLFQNDPLIPEEIYSGYKATGCYNTAIIMSIGGALNNQSLAASLPIATHTHDVKWTMQVHGINSYILTMKQYDVQRADQANPYYFDRALYDFGSADAILYPAACDLTKYKHCKSAETKLGDMAVARAFDGGIFTSEDAIENILVGAFQIIAFHWSENSNAFGIRVTIKNGEPHKVAIAGFDRASAYPLLINDPGSGTRRSARIIMLKNTSQHIVLDADGNAINQWSALEFQDAPGTFLLLEHVDQFRLY